MTTALRLVRPQRPPITCPDWCVESHDGYTDTSAWLGDLVVHQGVTAHIPTDADTLTLERTFSTLPDGTPSDQPEGFLVGSEYFVTMEQAVRMAFAILETVRGPSGVSDFLTRLNELDALGDNAVNAVMGALAASVSEEAWQAALDVARALA